MHDWNLIYTQRSVQLVTMCECANCTSQVGRLRWTLDDVSAEVCKLQTPTLPTTNQKPASDAFALLNWQYVITSTAADTIRNFSVSCNFFLPTCNDPCVNGSLLASEVLRNNFIAYRRNGVKTEELIAFLCCSLFAGSHYGAHSPGEAKSGYPYLGTMDMCASRVHWKRKKMLRSAWTTLHQMLDPVDKHKGFIFFSCIYFRRHHCTI